MTTQEQADLSALRTEVRAIAVRIDSIEEFVAQAKGALSLARFVLTFLGVGGFATFVVLLAQNVKT